MRSAKKYRTLPGPNTEPAAGSTRNGTASLRVHSAGDRGEVQVAGFLEKVGELVKNKSLVVNF